MTMYDYAAVCIARKKRRSRWIGVVEWLIAFFVMLLMLMAVAGMFIVTGAKADTYYGYGHGTTSPYLYNQYDPYRNEYRRHQEESLQLQREMLWETEKTNRILRERELNDMIRRLEEE